MSSKSKGAVLVLYLLASVELFAQAIAPPVAEYRGTKVDGMFEIRNNADFPLATILEPRSFQVDEKGQVHYSPLDKTVALQMGSSSFIVRPHDSHMVFYKASFPSAPTSFSIIVTMTKAGPVEGMRINYVLPHMIYAYQKEKLHPSDIRLGLANGILHIQNLSAKLGRVDGVKDSKEALGGFPLYPGQTRELQVAGEDVTVAFEDGFKVVAPK